MNEQKCSTTRSALRRRSETLFSRGIRSPKDAACIGPEATLAVEKGEAVLIILANNKGVAAIDIGDIPIATQHSWRIHCGYAGCFKASLHQFLMGDPPYFGLITDHANRFKLDCRRKNLRWATRGQNNANNEGHTFPQRSIKFKGVSSNGSRFVAYCKPAGFLGGFKTQEAAAKAYDIAALKHFGEFAALNFPDLKLQYFIEAITFKSLSDLTPIPCSVCGITFSPRTHREKTCSRPCSKIHEQRRQNERRRIFGRS